MDPFRSSSRPPKCTSHLGIGLVPGHSDRLRVNYTQSGPPHNYQFELSRRNYGTGIYAPETTIDDTDGISPATFEGVNRGYWYKARGRNCSDNTHTACGTWSNYTLPVELSDPGITISGLASSMASGGNDHFLVTLSDATRGQQYTITVSTDDDGLGFDASCLQTESRSFSPVVSSYKRNFTLYACDTPGGTVTAQLRKGGASGNLIDTATFSVTVTATTTTSTPGGPTVPTGGPSVNAGADQTVSTGATVSLFGTGSPVNDDDDATYNWTQQSGTTVSLKNAVTPSLPYTSGLGGNAAKFTAPSTAGKLIFRLTVTDAGTGLSSWDELAITVQ